jgi:hypothetical protein
LKSLAYELFNDTKFVAINGKLHENSHENVVNNSTIRSISGLSGSSYFNINFHENVHVTG